MTRLVCILPIIKLQNDQRARFMKIHLLFLKMDYFAENCRSAKCKTGHKMQASSRDFIRFIDLVLSMVYELDSPLNKIYTRAQILLQSGLHHIISSGLIVPKIARVLIQYM